MSATREDDRVLDGAIEVNLADTRGRSLVWALVFLGLGGLAIWGLAGGGKVVGVIIALPGLRHLYSLVRGLLHPPGRIRITDEELLLTPRLSAGRELKLPWPRVKRAYMLKRTVPWTKSGPLLVIETDEGRYVYPRDWFQVEGEQRDVARRLARRLGTL